MTPVLYQGWNATYLSLVERRTSRVTFQNDSYISTPTSVPLLKQPLQKIAVLVTNHVCWTTGGMVG